jgi:DNA-binding transcriptional ArsR family regulator
MKEMQHQTADPFHAIGDPSRRHILQLLTDKTLTINELAENFEMSRPAVSKHVKLLYTAGFIAIEDIGRERHCMLKPEGFIALQQWISYFDAFWNSKIKNLETLMREKAG